MPELHLKQPGLNNSACGTFTEHREIIQKYKETGDLNYFYKNELDKVCGANDAVYSNSKDLAKRTVLDKVLKERMKERRIERMKFL